MDEYIKKTDAAHIAIDSALHDAVWCAARIRALPPADVRPVVRAKWIETTEEEMHVERTFRCSNCGFNAWGIDERTNYCGNCGADMRGGDAEWTIRKPE